MVTAAVFEPELQLATAGLKRPSLACSSVLLCATKEPPPDTFRQLKPLQLAGQRVPNGCRECTTESMDSECLQNSAKQSRRLHQRYSCLTSS